MVENVFVVILALVVMVANVVMIANVVLTVIAVSMALVEILRIHFCITLARNKVCCMGQTKTHRLEARSGLASDVYQFGCYYPIYIFPHVQSRWTSSAAYI